MEGGPVGVWLRRRRELHGETVSAVADLAGITAEHLRGLESGRSELRDAVTILRLARALGANSYVLWGRVASEIEHGKMEVHVS